MALLWIDGFDSYGTSVGSAPSPTGIVARKYGVVVNESYFAIRAGRLSGYSMQLAGWTTSFQTPVLTTNALMVVGLAMKFAAIQDGVLLSFMDGTTQGVNLQLTSAGELAVYRGGSLLGTTSGLGLTTGAWYYITLKVLCGGGTSGAYVVYVGTTSVLSSSAANTQAGSHAYHDRFRIENGYNIEATIDDLYCLDSGGSINNDVLGNMRVGTLRPDGAGGNTDWTPDSGSNYNRVNEAVCGDDSNYVEDSVSGHTDTYTYGNIAGITDIAGLMVSTDCRETDANSFSLVTVCNPGVTESDDTAQPIGSTSYVTKRRILENNPDTSAPWTPTALNAAQFGVKVG